MNKVAILIISGLTIVIVLLLLFNRGKVIDNSLQDYQVAQRDSLIHQLSRQRTVDSLKTAQKLAELRDSLKNERKHGVKLSISLAHYKEKPEVVKIVQANPVIDTVFQYYDSLLQSKDNQIAIQDSKILVLEEENKRITANFLERLQLTEQNYLAQKAIADSYKKENRKVRRANRLLKVGLVVFGVGGLIAGSQL